MGSTDKKRRKRTLTGNQQAALLELLAGHTITDAAQRTGIARQTISGWVNQDDIFAAELANRRLAIRNSLTRRLEGHALRAVDRLGALLDSANEAVALKAASALLERFDGLPEPTPQLVVEYTPVDVMVDRESAEKQAKKARYYRRLV